MKTDDLIQALAADTVAEARPSARLTRAFPLAAVVPFVAVVLFWQTRPDLFQALTTYPIYKTLVPVVLSMAALWLCLSMSRPEARPRAQATVLGVVLAAIGAVLIYALVTTSSADLAMILDEPDYWNCVFSVPALAIPALGAMFWALRSGAPRRPVLGGAVAGLAAGGIGAAAYSLHCPHDSLMYFFSGYGVAIAAVTGLGALIGWKALRW